MIRPPALLCFGATGDGELEDPTPETPAAIIEQVIETVDGQSYVHIRVTFDPSFADNTYGANASAGWSEGELAKGHTFRDLVGSDHLQLLLTNGEGSTVIELKEDYLTVAEETASASSCGYGTLGVTGGEGKMITGESTAVLAASTSMDRNLNACGYCQVEACSGGDDAEGVGDCTVNSPATDESYTPNPQAPNWNYAMVYEIWLDLEAFGDAGFGQAYITQVHASPSKLADNTLYVEPTPCPPTWGTCPAGQICAWGGTGGSGGESGVGGGGNTTSCDPNSQLYTTMEGELICTPIPYAGYPDMAACPAGYALDLSTEGQYCIPIR